MKKKNSKKRSYRSTLLILLITLVLLIVSTYAWFTSNRTVTVDTIEVNVGAVNGLQISTDASTWKTIINNTDITSGAYTANVNQFPSKLAPCSTDTSTDASTGYMNMYYGVVEADTDGVFKLTSTKQTDTKENGDTATGHYIAFDMFLKLDGTEDQKVYLTSASGVSPKATSKGLENAARIAFVKEGNVTAAAGASAATPLKGASKVILWEPNNNAHTAAAITHASDTYSQTITASQVFANYYGVKAAFAKEALTSSDSAKFAQVTPDIKTGTTMTTEEFDTLTPGITKYRVYMWVEGQDYDCENNASGTDIKFDMQFSLDNT